MAILAPLAAIGGGSASALAGIATAVSVASGIVGTISAVQQANFNQKLAARNATIAEDNARRSIYEGQLKAQQADLDASQEMGQLLARQSVSGLTGKTYALQRKSLRELASRDRGTIRFEAESLAQRYRQQGQDFQIEAAGERSAKSFAILSGLGDVGSSLISGAAKYSALKQKELYA